jgi:putative ABC transport system permease protein
MKVKAGDTVVVIATNPDGSVNGKQLRVSAILESATGPGGRDGYIHIDDAAEVLRFEGREVSEVAVRLADFRGLGSFTERLTDLLDKELNPQGKPVFEVHSWEKTVPFPQHRPDDRRDDLLHEAHADRHRAVSIMNVMIMAVYERIREIGTIAAIGTLPGRILSLFVLEGLSLGIGGAILGNVVGAAVLFALNMAGITYDFGRQKGLLLKAAIDPAEVLALSVIVVVISVIASLQPAFKASRMEPIEALRHV